MKNAIIVREKLFKGYNDRLAPEYLPAGYLADALNCFIRTGEIVKRNGYTIIANDIGANAIQGLRGVRFADATKELLMVANGIVYKYTGSGNWSSITGTYTLSATANVEIVVANNNVYFFDGTNTVPKYNGTTMSTVAAIPIGSAASWFHNAMYIIGISGNPNRLRISNNGDPEDYSAGTQATLDINPNDGDYLTGVAPFNNELVLFKTQRAWSLTGFGTSALTLVNLNERVSGFGTVSQRSIVNTGNDLIYLGFLGDRPHFRSLTRTRFAVTVEGGIVSSDIETSLNGMNKAQLTKVAGIFDGRNVWYGVPHGASTTNNRVYMYDTLLKGWVRHTGINSSCWETFTIANTPQLYFGEAGADSKVYVMDTSTSDNGSTINFQVNTRRYGADRAEIKKKWKSLILHADETGNYDLDINYSKDGFTFDDLGTFNLSGTGAVFNNIILDTSRLGETDVKHRTFYIPKSKDVYMQFQFADTSATSSINIRGWEILSIPKNVREFA